MSVPLSEPPGRLKEAEPTFYMRNYLIKNISIVNEGKVTTADLLLKNGRIEKMGTALAPSFAVTEINGEGLCIYCPGSSTLIRFISREPRLTQRLCHLPILEAKSGGSQRRYLCSWRCRILYRRPLRRNYSKRNMPSAPVLRWPIILFIWVLRTTMPMRPC